ncbi:MAG: 30S ribosomal protein S5 [Patescibacteria group bacterium]
MAQRRMRQRDRGQPRREDDFEQKVIDISRVTRVMAGGKRMRFRALVVVGDHKGLVGAGLAKGADVSLAIGKATTKARKELIKVPITKETIPHKIKAKYGSAEVLLKPAPVGTGVIAGGAVRVVLGVAGVPNVVAKILGSANKINNVRAVFKALENFKLKS